MCTNKVDTMNLKEARARKSEKEALAEKEKQRIKGENKMEEKIRNGIEQIRPFLQRDGGDIEFVEYTDDNIVKVRLLGHCKGCPHRQATINGMVAQVLQESYPEVAGVVAVD